MMFSNMLLKRLFALRVLHRKGMGFALPQRVLSPKIPVIQQYIKLHVGSCLFTEVNSISSREILTNEFTSKEETGINSKQIAELLNHLDYEIYNFGRVKYEDAEMLLQLMEKGLIADHENYAFLLLKWCGQLMPDKDVRTRISLAHAVWKVLGSLGTKIKTEHYNALLKCYVANDHGVLVSKFLTDMGEVVPNNTTYELLLECACIVGDMEQASHILQLMKDKNISINEAIFNYLILGHARSGDIKSSLSILDTMNAAHLSPSANTYSALLQSYAEFGDIENMKKIYEEAVSKNVNFNIKQIMYICRILALRQHHEVISEFLALLPEDLKKLSFVVQNTVIELVHSKCHEAAFQLMASILPDASSSQLENPYAIFVFEMCRASIDPNSIINICCSLEKKKLYPKALYKAAESSLQLAKPELSLQIFQMLVKNGEVLQAHYFWPLFRQNARTEGEEGVLRTLKSMQTLGVTPDYHTLLDYVLPVVTSYNPGNTVEKLKLHGISVRQSLTPIVADLLLSGKINPLVHLCESYPTKMDFDKLVEPLVEVFTSRRCFEFVASFLKAAAKHSSTDLAGQFLLQLLTVKSVRYTSEDVFKLLQSFKDAGLSISSSAADVLNQYFKNGGTNPNMYPEAVAQLLSLTEPEIHISSVETMSIHIAHPREMNLEELENHLVEMRSKEMNTRGVLRRLLQLHMSQGNVKRVDEVRKEFEDSGFKFSSGMQASLFDMYIQSKNASTAGKILNEIMNDNPDFVVDEHKIINYAALLIEDDQYKAAVAVLERRAASARILGGENVSRNCRLLLNSLALKGEVEKVKHMLHLLRTLGYCSPSNIILGTVLRAHLVRGDLDGAVREYKNCAKEFKKTPLQVELMIHLVERATGSTDNQKFLEEVLAATISIHGEASSLSAYVTALAECDKKNELRNFLEEHGNAIHYVGLINRAKRLAKEDKLQPLSILADTCKNIPGFDVSPLYTCMLHVYDKHGDSDGALKLWTEMQEKNVQPSEEFLHSLSSILKSHNKPIPFVTENI